MNRVLILTAGFGEGHNAAARNLAIALDERGGKGTANIIDAFALAAPRMNKVARSAYLGLINHSPKIWSAIYSLADRPGVMPKCMRFLRREMSVLVDVIRKTNPTMICSTYPVYAFMIEDLKKAGKISPALPQYNIVTDSISLNSLWWRAACDGWYVPNDDSAEVLAEAGVPADQIYSFGFPVPPRMADDAARLSPPDMHAGAKPKILYMVNSGTKNASATAKLLFENPSWEVTCAVGRDDALRRRMESMAGENKGHKILGWTNDIPGLLLTHHAVVSKAGGATTQEAIAARCPMIVNQIVPGQEEGNYELLRRHGVGALAEQPQKVHDALVEGFANGGKIWDAWRAALNSIAKPDAARTIARHLLASVSADADLAVKK